VSEREQEIATPTQTVMVFELSSGRPGESREVDERGAMCQISKMRARKVGYGDGHDTRELTETLARDWRRAAWFYSRFGIPGRRIRF